MKRRKIRNPKPEIRNLPAYFPGACRFPFPVQAPTFMALVVPAGSVRAATGWAFAAVIAANVIWGTSFLLGKIALRDLLPVHVVAGRFLIASAVLLPMAMRRGLRVHRRDLPLFALAAVLMVPVMMLVQYEGLDRTSATSAALIIGTIPVLLALAAVVFGRESLSAKGWLAVAVSTFGAGLMVGVPGPGRTMLGDALVFASAFAAVGWVFVTRRLLQRYGTVTTTAVTAGLGTLFVLPFLLAKGLPEAPVSAASWSAVVGLGVLCTALTYVLWNWGLHRLPTARVAPFVNLEPMVGAVLGLTLLGEPIGPVAVVGGLLILGASIATTTGGHPPEAAADVHAAP